MGYDPKRFLITVDDEFICAICSFVLESPVQTTCEHLFCNKCITDWLDIKGTCPVDGRQLTTNNLSEPNRTIRNLLYKLDIKCDFEQLGCGTVTKLEHLAQHVKRCEYNMDGEVVCDKGCNGTMTRREYQNENCFAHLAKQLAALSREKELETARIRHELSEQKVFFERTVGILSKEIRTLREENSKVRQKLEIVELCAGSSSSEAPEFQVKHNVKIGPQNVLQEDQPNPKSYSFVQSAHALTRTRPRFKLLTSPARFRIGLTRRGYFREWLEVKKTFGQQGDDIYHRIDRDDNFLHLVKNIGGLIECGIEFPEDFIDDGSHSANVYVSVNQKLISKESHVIPADGFFPTIIFFNSELKLRIKSF